MLFVRQLSVRRTLGASALVGLIALSGCGTGRGESAAAPAPGASPTLARPIPVAVELARVGPISSYYSATATLEAQKEAAVLARVAGQIIALHAEEGDDVAEGEPLLEIETDAYRLRVDQAEATVRDLESRVERMEQLSRDIVSAEELETTRNELATAKATAGLATLELSHTTVKAPFSGRVVTRHVDLGAMLSVGTPLFDVADLRPLLARVHVPAKEFRQLRTDQEVELVLDSTGDRLRGTISLISPTIDPTKGTIKVTAEIEEYPEGTRPGDFARVQIVTDRHEEAVLVPRLALVTERGEQVLFVARDGVAERRVIRTGFTDDEFAEIIEGVLPGEQVVVKGQRSLEHGAPLRILTDEWSITGKEDGASGSS